MLMKIQWRRPSSLDLPLVTAQELPVAAVQSQRYRRRTEVSPPTHPMVTSMDLHPPAAHTAIWCLPALRLLAALPQEQWTSPTSSSIHSSQDSPLQILLVIQIIFNSSRITNHLSIPLPNERPWPLAPEVYHPLLILMPSSCRLPLNRLPVLTGVNHPRKRTFLKREIPKHTFSRSKSSRSDSIHRTSTSTTNPHLLTLHIPQLRMAFTSNITIHPPRINLSLSRCGTQSPPCSLIIHRAKCSGFRRE